MVGSSRILMFQTSTLRTLTSGLILAVAYSLRLSKKTGHCIFPLRHLLNTVPRRCRMERKGFEVTFAPMPEGSTQVTDSEELIITA